MEQLWDVLLKFYGLDWIGMIVSFYGTYLITKRDRIGFIYCIMGCISGGTVSYLTNIPSYILYNMIFLVINIKGYWNWGTQRCEVFQSSAALAR
jgi:hypothetical protein